jgi:nucleolar protein 58
LLWKPNQQKRIKLGPAASTYNPATDAVGLVSTQREPMEEAVKAVLDVKEEKRRAKRRAEKEKAAAAQEAEKPDAAASDGEADAMEEDGEEKVDEKKRKRRKSEVTSSAAMDDGVVAAMVRGPLFFCSREAQGMLTVRD